MIDVGADLRDLVASRDRDILALAKTALPSADAVWLAGRMASSDDIPRRRRAGARIRLTANEKRLVRKYGKR